MAPPQITSRSGLVLPKTFRRGFQSGVQRQRVDAARFFCQLGQTARLPSDRQDLRTFVRSPPHDLAADAPAGAKDDDPLALQAIRFPTTLLKSPPILLLL